MYRWATTGSGGQDMKRIRSALQWVPMAVSWSAIALASFQELRKPASERTWHGHVLGFIPYDFRPPSVERIRASLWNPADPHVITAQPFGVGWSINFYQLAQRISKTTARPD